MTLIGLVAVAGWAGVAILLLFWRSFIPEYLREKAKNLATHEDMDKIVHQVNAVTTVTEEIKSKISSELWDRQKQWELRREMIVEASKTISEIEEALIGIKAALQVRKEPEEENWKTAYFGALQKWRGAISAFDQAKMLVAIVCSRKTANTISDYGVFTAQLSSAMTKSKHAKTYDDAAEDLYLKYQTVGQALRAELGITDSTPQSSGSSATPSSGS